MLKITIPSDCIPHLGGLGEGVVEAVGVNDPPSPDLVDRPHPAAGHRGLVLGGDVRHGLQLHGPLLHHKHSFKW